MRKAKLALLLFCALSVIFGQDVQEVETQPYEGPYALVDRSAETTEEVPEELPEEADSTTENEEEPWTGKVSGLLLIIFGGGVTGVVAFILNMAKTIPGIKQTLKKILAILKKVGYTTRGAAGLINSVGLLLIKLSDGDWTSDEAYEVKQEFMKALEAFIDNDAVKLDEALSNAKQKAEKTTKKAAGRSRHAKSF